MSGNNFGNNNNVKENANDNANNNGINNATNNVVNKEDLPQLLDFRGGSHVTNVPHLDVEDFSSWKDRFLVYLDGLEPFLLEILENGPYIPKSLASTQDNFLASLKSSGHLRTESLQIKIRDRKDIDSDVEEDTRSSQEFLVDLNQEYHDKALMVEITMKNVQRLLSMIDSDERKHVLNYTMVDLHYVKDQRKNLLSKFNSLKQELFSYKSDCIDLKKTSRSKTYPFNMKLADWM
ncbi:hypothetical protein Tco_0895117 [Tanacetum coccineum]|uniref:Uncharacterized protein n=1 Tax=Tanacetum coccineum TaxID=301880 RepID=A0ABQ5CDM7_9ASTR